MYVQSFTRSALVEPELMQASTAEDSGLEKLHQMVKNVSSVGDTRARIQIIMELAAQLPRLPTEAKVSANRVMGCTSQVTHSILLSFLLNRRIVVLKL